MGILQCSYQSPSDRYPKKGDVRAPGVAWYRNNLTALSQCRNLFFAAYDDQIYVYKPRFPSQKISSKPEMIIDLPRTSQNLSGYINPTKPHSVNQLVVSDLGHEEIIAVTCDDGDVVAYTIRSIYDALERDILDEPGAQFPRIRTILLRNVGESAWGLAVHQAARLIAVSSNTHIITVFAFALCREPSPDSLYESDEGSVLPSIDIDLGPDEWVRQLTRPESPVCRSTRNLEIILKGHAYNIPNITFCNTDADPNGRYLVSTDIGGVTYVWDIWQRQVLADISATQKRGINYAGWGVVCLDPLSCRLSSTVSETFGCHDVSYCPRTDLSFGTPGAIYNNSTSTDAVPDSSTYHPVYAVLSNGPRPAGITPLAGAQLLAQLLESDDEDPDEEDEYEEPEDMASHSVVLQDSTPFMADNLNTEMTPMETDEDLPTLQASISRSKRRISTLPFHVFQTARFDFRLMSDIRYGSVVEEGATCDTVLCQKALYQKIPPGFRHPGYVERLNMVLQIPELGLVAVAHQGGRVALLTMTKRAKNDQFGFRLEWLLPFRAQEDAGQRPDVALMGMAIGPVQGCGRISSSSTDEPRDQKGFVNGTQRYRLLLTYYDHTILSYEIRRSVADSRSGVEDRILVL